MALVVETGSGSSTAESYVSVAEADTYNANVKRSASWAKAGTDQKEQALRVATQYLETAFGGSWSGLRNSGTQSLSWPRFGVFSDGVRLDSATIPQNLRRATVEIACRFLDGGEEDLVPDVSSGAGDVKAESVKVGAIEVETQYQGSAKPAKRFPFVRRLLESAGLIDDVSRMSRG